MEKLSRKIWEHPWGYAEGFIVASGVLLAGLMLQLTIGNIDPAAFGFPVNIIIGALFMVGLLSLHFFLRRKKIVRWLSGVSSTIPAISLLLAVIVIMGFTPQFSDHVSREQLPPTPLRGLGWYQMTTSWPFVLLCFYLLTILGLTTLRRTTKKKGWRDIGFYLNHVGLFLALLGGMLGSGDMKRYTMSVKEGTVEWCGTDQMGQMHELPIAIQLDTFMIEEYPPKLVIIDNQTGRILPADRPEAYMFEGVGKTTTLAGNRIEILDFMADAAIVRDSNIVNFVQMPMEGATNAIKVRVTHPSIDQPVEGWVSNGSYLYPYEVLYIDSTTSVAMPVQEVKKYTSKVTVYTKSGHVRKAEIEVNRPLSIENKVVYQYSYDETRGKYSQVSIFEIVTDPWLAVVYAGIFMLLAGALFMFIVGPRRETKPEG